MLLLMRNKNNFIRNNNLSVIPLRDVITISKTTPYHPQYQHQQQLKFSSNNIHTNCNNRCQIKKWYQYLDHQQSIIGTCSYTTRNNVLLTLHQTKQQQRIPSVLFVHSKYYSTTTARTSSSSSSSSSNNNNNTIKPKILQKIPGISLQASAGCLKDQTSIIMDNTTSTTTTTKRKRILILCTGGTMTMVPDPTNNNALKPKQGTLVQYIQNYMIPELYNYKYNQNIPDIVLHEYIPFLDSSDLGPDEFANVVIDIYNNYIYYDGFVIVTGTDTMAYFATSISFMIQNLNKPIILTGSQIPLCYPYNDARHNLIMSILFASSNNHTNHNSTITSTRSSSSSKSSKSVPTWMNEVTIFFHDRLLRGNRTTKINTHSLLAFDSPNMKPLATVGISIQENKDILPIQHVPITLPSSATTTTNKICDQSIQINTSFDTRLLTLRLIPGFDDAMIKNMIECNQQRPFLLRGLILQLYGTGNMPSLKQSFIDLLAYAKYECNIIVVATTQCISGSVQFNNYAVGTVMEQQAGVISAYDMTTEATVCKLAYLLGHTNHQLSNKQIEYYMNQSLRGEMTTQLLSSTRHS